jgi:transcription-repair coupling factor (superfamily II helicase)
VLEHFLHLPNLLSLAQSMETSPCVSIDCTNNSCKALIISFVEKVIQKPIVIISKDTSSHDQLIENIPFFSKTTSLELPGLPESAEDSFFSNPEIIGERFKTLHQLYNSKKPFFIFTEIQAFKNPILSPQTLNEKCLQISKGQSIVFSLLTEKLFELGYNLKDLTTYPGEFSKRGGILDIYPLGNAMPVRLEFWDDEIESIRSFHPLSQRSEETLNSITILPAKAASVIDSVNSTKNEFAHYLEKESLIIFNDIEIKDLPKESQDSLSKFKSISFNQQQQDSWNSPFCSIQNILSPFTTSEEKFSVLEYLETLFQLPKKSYSLHFVTQTSQDKILLQQRIKDFSTNSSPKAHIHQGYLSDSFCIKEENELWISWSKLQKRQKPHKKRQPSVAQLNPLDYQKLFPDDYVVHIHHGIGRFLGIEEKPNHERILSEFLHIEYADNASVFVPVTQSHLISKYIGANEEQVPTLNKLGQSQWKKTKRQAEKAILAYATDLLDLYAKRSLAKIIPFSKDSPELLNIESTFPFEETQDQYQAIEDCKKDLQSSSPMDRLICGDVGFGKTEVSFRAAVKTVIDGHKQAALLVPTTVLAMQHYDYFKERIGEFPIRVEILSRLQSSSHVTATLKDLKAGKIDILVGTHKILGKSVIFKDLGLLMIDEEQRFGVQAKEHLKKLKESIHSLTLSATPIPRTLYLSLMGTRDLSLLNTPPISRLPIQNYITESNYEIIQQAIHKELERKGQIFIVHNRIKTLPSFAQKIQELVPNASICIGNGQMPPSELDRIFHQFKNGQADILISTTIIESGVDVPNANTIIVDRADTFGLADLYQLRGRVGRGNRQAYAFFLTPPNRQLPEKAQKRLDSLMEIQGLGGGMQLAMKDLEIRGAGNILGNQQSGHLASIGFHFYCKLLKQTIAALEGKQLNYFKEIKLIFPFDARLPKSYVEDPRLRMQLYQSLGQANSLEEVDELFEEIKDRFGHPPKAAIYLHHLMRIQVIASSYHIVTIEVTSFNIYFLQQKGKLKKEKKVLSKIPKDPEKLEKFITKLLVKEFN